MGFRCPKCHQDFGINKQAFLEHCKICGDGLVNALYSLYVDKDNSKLKKYIQKLKEQTNEK